MNIGIISDTHDQRERILEAIALYETETNEGKLVLF
jgi:predicted phosphodiesterase